MRAGQIIAERVKRSDGTDFWKVYTVKSVTPTGIATLLRADSSSTMEAKTTKGFAQAVDDGTLEGWSHIDTSAVDICVTNAVAGGGKVELDSSYRRTLAAELRSRVAHMTGSSEAKHAEARTMLDIADELHPEIEVES